MAEEKRIQWTACFADQEYYTLGHLREMDDEDWRIFEKKLPIRVLSLIRKELKKISDQEQLKKEREDPRHRY